MIQDMWRTVAVFTAGVALGSMSVVQVIPSGLGGGGGLATTDEELAESLEALGIEPTEGGLGANASGPQVGPGGGAGTDGSGAGTDGSGAGSTGGAGTTGGGGEASAGGSGGGSGGGSNNTSQGGGGGDLACEAGRNGGATDTGVSADAIQLATTVVDSGIGKAFLGDVKFAMEAVRQRVNRQGGVCGRQLAITYRDDGWSAQTGAQYLRNFIQSGVFAVPVGPSSEGLNVVINSGDFDANQVAVVGTDGLIISQYQKRDGQAQPWVWPVAVATVSSARIIANAAYEAGARDFSIVFDKNFRFGQEAALAFNAEVKRLTGSDVPGFNESLNCEGAFCGIEAGRGRYNSDVETWRRERGDFTALFLEPQTALVWMNDANTPAASEHDYGAGQTLFTRGFAEECKGQCDQMQVWTGFKPFQERYRSDPAVQRYVNDLEAVNPNADALNQFVVGGYVGMRLLVEALEAVGPNLTRERFKQALDGSRLETGLTLTDTLEYDPDNRYVATSMQAWTIKFKGSFNGWEAGSTVRDPRPQAGTG